MYQPSKYHFTIDSQSDLLSDIDIWEPALPGVFEKGHFHSYYEILIFRKGGGTHQMSNDIFEVNDFSIHILTNNNFHELKRTVETEGFEIIFSEVFLEQLQQFDKKTNYIKYFSKSRVLNYDAKDFNELNVYFEELIKHKGNKSLVNNLVSLILLKIISGDINENKSISNISFEKTVISLLNKHYKDKHNLEFYASKLNMSPTTFQRHTKQAFGKSVIELQNEKIIQEVKYLLSLNEKPIKEISSDFNFTDESHFTHFFRKRIGISPSAFRKSSMINYTKD